MQKQYKKSNLRTFLKLIFNYSMNLFLSNLKLNICIIKIGYKASFCQNKKSTLARVVGDAFETLIYVDIVQFNAVFLLIFFFFFSWYVIAR